jgi:hypothetical protein
MLTLRQNSIFQYVTLIKITLTCCIYTIPHKGGNGNDYDKHGMAKDCDCCGENVGGEDGKIQKLVKSLLMSSNYTIPTQHVGNPAMSWTF